MGPIPSAQTVKHAPVVMNLGYSQNAATMQAARSGVGSALAALQGILEIELVDAPGIVRYGLFTGGVGTTLGVPLIDTTYQMAGKITCHDATWYSRMWQPIAVPGGQRVRVPMGTTQGLTRATITGPTTLGTLTLTSRDRTGAPVATMRLTVTLGANDMVFIDLDDNQLAIYLAGVAQANPLDLLNDFDTFLAISLERGTTLDVSEGVLRVFHGQAWAA
jgi:hypothetical protein